MTWMKKILYIIVITLLILTVFIAYIRLMPSNSSRWHQPIEATHSANFKPGAVRVLSAEENTLARVDAIMTQLPRTRVLDGSVNQGRITYVTRTKWIGFPDYTTVEYSDGTLKMYARLRFGTSDMGVNRERLEAVMRDAGL